MRKENSLPSNKGEIRCSLLRRVMDSELASLLMNTFLEVYFAGQAFYQEMKSAIESKKGPHWKQLEEVVTKAIFTNADQVSEQGLRLYLEGIRKALEGEGIVSVGLMIFGTSHDLFDGARARSNGGLLVKAAVKAKKDLPNPSFANEKGQLKDVLSDRMREVGAFLEMAKLFKEDRQAFTRIIDIALSCALPSIARAYVESKGYRVPELGISVVDAQGTSPWRILKIARMALQLGRGKNEEALATAEDIWEANLRTAKNRLDQENWIELLPEADDYQQVIKEGEERYIALVELMDSIIKERGLEESLGFQEGWVVWANTHEGIELPLP